MTIHRFLFAQFILFFCISEIANSQCACMGGAPVGGFTPVGGTSNIGILREKNLRALTFFSYSNGDRYFKGDSPTENGLVKNFKSTYSGLLIGYGLFEQLTIDAEIGYFIDKSQEFADYTLSGTGFSHATLYAKYNAFNSRADEWEWTIGIGGRIPINISEQNLPQNIQSSTGAYGGVLLSYLHKGFKAQGLHFILVNRADFNSENNTTFKYGSNFINSIFVTKSIFQNLVGMLEVRTDIKLKDSKYGKQNDDSGWNILILSPQINYGFSKFNLSVFCDLPVYKYYNGKQLTNNSNIGVSLTWQSKLFN